MSASKPQLLVFSKPIYATEEFYSQIGEIADIVVLKSKNREEFKEEVKTFSNLVAVFPNGGQLGAIDADVFKILPSSVKTIANFGAGYDKIDVHAAYSANCHVSNTPGSVDQATATTAVYLILAAIRLFSRAEASARAGNWNKGLALARDPEDKVLGIVGMGGIGSVVGRRMLGWNMKILYYNRNEISPKPDFECEYVSSLEELLGRSDVVSLHMPLNANTEKSFGAKQFAAMKEKSVLVNTARGGVIDEPALLEALKSGKLAAAGLDVFPDEPNINPELLKFDNVTVLPHMGTETTDTRHKMGMMVINNFLAGIKGQPLINLVPEQKKLQAEGK